MNQADKIYKQQLINFNKGLEINIKMAQHTIAENLKEIELIKNQITQRRESLKLSQRQLKLSVKQLKKLK